jgi:ABC-type glycerol-3-phosphate transport system permease component
MNFSTNVGLIDRVLRILIAAGLAYAYFSGKLQGIAGVVLLVVAVVLVITSFVGFCPLYRIFNLSTAKKKE